MNYIVFDLEWNQGIAGKRESSHEEIPFEIIEIGAIKLDKRKNIIGQFQKIIKPSVKSFFSLIYISYIYLL